MAQKQSFHGLECLAIKLLIMRSEGLNNMLHYAWVFLVVALIAAFLGFGGVAGTAAGIAKILFGDLPRHVPGELHHGTTKRLASEHTKNQAAAKPDNGMICGLSYRIRCPCPGPQGTEA